MSGGPRDEDADAPLYAVSAEFDTPDGVLAAARALRPRALGRLDIYSPVPLQGAVEAVGRPHRAIPHAMGIGAFVIGFVLMMGMCIYATAFDYKFDIGGRPLISWPSFVVPSISFGVLTAALVLFANWAFLCRLPMLNHPSFNIPGFLRATQDRYFLTIEPMPNAAVDAHVVERALARLPVRPLNIARVRR